MSAERTAPAEQSSDEPAPQTTVRTRTRKQRQAERRARRLEQQGAEVPPDLGGPAVDPEIAAGAPPETEGRSDAIMGHEPRIVHDDSPDDSAPPASEEEALRLAEDALAGLVGRVLQTDPATLDRSRRLDLLGMDSLMAAELARDLRTRLGCDIPVVELSGAASLTALAHRVLTDRTGPPAPRVPGLRAPQDPGARAGAGEEAVR